MIPHSRSNFLLSQEGLNLTFLFSCSDIRTMDTEILLPEYTGLLSGTKWITTWDYVWSVHTKTLSI